MAITRDERQVSQQRPVWARPETLQIEKGLARIKMDPKQMYDPSDHPNLPNAFAKAIDEASIERFLTEFGHLGWWGLLSEEQQKMWPKSYRPGLLSRTEPIDWIIAQAKTVGFALELIEALQEDAEERLGRILRTRRLTVHEAETYPKEARTSSGSLYATYYIAEGGGYGGGGGKFGDAAEDIGGWYTTGLYHLPKKDEGLRMHALEIVADLVERNTRGVRETLKIDFETKGFGMKLGARGLIEIIWLLVRDMALGGELRRCEECGAPFLVTDRRQRYCPPDLPGTNSRCAARAQKRRQRSR